MFSKLCTISSLYCLTQAVTGPTHVHHDDSQSTIDLLFVSEPLSLISCDTVASLSNSDYRGILIDFSKKREVLACILNNQFCSSNNKTIDLD